MDSDVNMKKGLWILLPPLLVILIISLTWNYAGHDWVKKVALSEIQKFNAGQKSVEINLEDLEISLLKLQAQVDGININFKSELSYLPSVNVRHAKLQLDIFNLVIGRISASYVLIAGADYMIDEKAYAQFFQGPSHGPPKIDLAPVFEYLPQIPVKNVFFVDLNAELKIPSSTELPISQLKVHFPKFRITNQSSALSVDGKDLLITAISRQNESASLFTDLRLQIDEQSLKSSQIVIHKNKSAIDFRLASSDIKNLLITPKTSTNLNARIQLEDLKDFLHVFRTSTDRLPHISGTLQIQSQVQSSSQTSNRGEISVQYQNIILDNFKFGSGQIESQVFNNNLRFDQVRIEHPSGIVKLKNINLENQKPFNFTADIDLEDFKLQNLFNSLNLKNIPASLDAEVKANCRGQVTNFSASCAGQIKAQNIKVDAGSNDSINIVKVAQLTADVSSYFTSEIFSFDSTVTLQKSKFKASGEVYFDKGFDFKCSSNGLDFSEIENIANLGLKGIVTGTLNTSGDSDYGIIESDLKVKNTEIDKFFLGDTEGHLSYRAGLLTLNPFKGIINNSNYNGGLTINLGKSLINGAFDIPSLYVTDALTIIEEKWHLPIQATGRGEAHVKFNGPLDFWAMNLDLKSKFKNGTLYDENYTQLIANIISDGKRMRFDDVRIHKPSGYLIVSNAIETDHKNKQPFFNLKLSSKGLKIEDVDHITQFYPSLTGNLQVGGEVTGYVDHIRMLPKLQFSETRLNSQLLPSSYLETELNKDFFSGHGQLLGRQLQAQFKLPFSENEPYQVKAEIQNFQTLLVLPFLGIPANNLETESTMTGSVNLTSQNKSLNSLTGTININEFSLSRGDLHLKLDQKVLMQFKNSGFEMGTATLSGSDQNLALQYKQDKLQIVGRLNLRPLQFLAPFTETMSGILEISTTMNLKDKGLSLNGEGLISNASVTSKGFPYPIKDIYAYFDLNGSKILFSEITATLNQANVFGHGLVDVQGAKNVKVSLEAETEELDIEFPSKIKTNGIAKILFSGNWLPYTLKVNYDVSGGLLTKEFTEGSENASFVVPPNIFLPETYLNKEKTSLLLNANVNFKRGIVVKNSLMEGLALGSITAKGPLDSFTLGGSIEIQPGSKLIFKDKPFEVRRGHVEFTDSKEINPALNINAFGKVSDYDITLDILGTGKNPQITATSQPFLAEKDIFSLLALGYTESQTNQTLSSEAQQTQTGLEVLSVIGNQSELSKKIQSRLGLNVQLAPSVDSTRNVAVPKVIVTKEINKKVQTSFSRTLTGDQQNNEVKLQWLFRPDTSVILNYQNQPRLQDDNIIYKEQNDIGVGDVGIEYKKEFK